MTDPRMTPTNDAPVTVEDRERAWLFRAGCYGSRDKVGWMNGKYDHIQLIQSYAAHRLAALASAPAGDGDREAADILRKHVVVETAPIDDATVSAIIAAMVEYAALARPRAAVGERAFQIGDRVEKISGSSWRGKVVGTYSTVLTPEGYAVESETETGSVQIYPAKALRLALQSPPAKVEG